MPDEPSAPRYPNVKKSDPEFREIQKIQDFDRSRHIEQSIEAGMTREEAEAHADEHLRERQDTRE